MKKKIWNKFKYKRKSNYAIYFTCAPTKKNKKTQHNEIWFHDVSRFNTLIWFVWYVNKIFLIEAKKNQQKKKNRVSYTLYNFTYFGLGSVCVYWCVIDGKLNFPMWVLFWTKFVSLMKMERKEIGFMQIFLNIKLLLLNVNWI